MLIDEHCSAQRKDVGGAFQQMPLCRSAQQTGV
ncbi:MAG: hypothetical protein U0Y68_08600 [Blastocatellia bacterium]